jgi:hypothetical protein
MKTGDLGRDVVLENVCGCLDDISDFPLQYPALFTHSFATRLASLKPCKCYVHDQVEQRKVQRPHTVISLDMLLQPTVEQGLQASLPDQQQNICCLVVSDLMIQSSFLCKG